MRKREERVLIEQVSPVRQYEGHYRRTKQGLQEAYDNKPIGIAFRQCNFSICHLLQFWTVRLLPVSGLETLHETRYIIIYILIECAHKNPKKNFYMYLCHIDLWIFADIWRRNAVTNYIHKWVITQLENLSVFSRCYGNLVDIKNPWYGSIDFIWQAVWKKPS